MTSCKVLCPCIGSLRGASCTKKEQADNSGVHHLLFFPFSALFLSRLLSFFRGNLPDTSAARRARWVDRGWRTAVCAVGSRRSPGASASDPGLLSDSAMGHRQRNGGETWLISLHYRGHLRWQMSRCGILGRRLTRVTAPSVGSMKTAVSEWSSPWSELHFALLSLISTRENTRKLSSAARVHQRLCAWDKRLTHINTEEAPSLLLLLLLSWLTSLK